MSQQALTQPSASRSTGRRIGFALASLVLGIASLLLVWVLGLGLVLALTAIIFGILGIRQSLGLAVTGLATGGLSLAVGLAVLILALISSAP